ncbi:MAG: Gfo/Idh/MocA family oxidoreductase [Lachnospiraceae bacterium]|nr:Gfo/Idh/MocA family oxidoreductase [Lachnospiraceae bacterium]
MLIRVALIGTGGMGRKYAQMLTNGEVKKLSLSAVVCRKEEAAKWAEETLPASAKIYPSSDALFEEPDQYDAVLIVTPHKTHPALAIKAFSLGKHVFCDKPAGVSAGDARGMYEASLKADKKYAMMFHQRLYGKYRRIKEILESGQLGKVCRVMMVNTRYYRTEFYHKSGSWRSSWSGEGGGTLINQGQHILDIWQWLFGLPESIYANIPFGKYNDFLVDDEATIHMTYSEGMTGVFMLSTGEAEWEERLEIVGTKGKILMEDDTITVSVFGEDIVEYGKHAQVTSRENLTFTRTKEAFPQDSEPYVEMFENFADAVLGTGKLIAPGQAGIGTLEITNATYLSAWKNEVIKLPVDPAEYEKALEQHIVMEQ